MSVPANAAADTGKIYDVVIQRKKTLDGGKPGVRRFNFRLADDGGTTVRETQNDAEGNAVFEKLTFDRDDDSFRIGNGGCSWQKENSTLTKKL